MISEGDYDLAYVINDNWDYLRYYKRDYANDDFYRFVIGCIHAAKASEIDETEDDV